MGKRLKDLRDKAGLSQEALARLAGLSTAAIFRIEQGRPSDPKLSTLSALGKALGMSPGEVADELVREEPKGKKSK